MTEVSVGGIKPGELCTITPPVFNVPEEALEIYDRLLQQGYKVNVITRPIEVEKIIWQNASIKVKQQYKALHKWLGKDYTHTVLIRTDNKFLAAGFDRHFDWAEQSSLKLKGMLNRSAMPNESIQLYITTSDSDKLVEEITKRIVASNGIPYLIGSNPELKHRLCVNAVSDEQLSHVRPDKLFLYETTQKQFEIFNDSGIIFTKAEELPDNMDEKEYTRRSELFSKANAKAKEPYMRRMARVEQGVLPPGKFFRTLALSPSADLACEMGFTPDDRGVDAFGIFYSKITHLDEKDPISHYKNMIPLVGHYAGQLQKFHTIKIKTDDGKTNVVFSIRDKGEKVSRYVAPSTITGNALPAEIFTSPVEDSVNGNIYFGLPFVLDKKEFNSLTLSFKDGKVIDLNLKEGDIDHIKGRILGIGPEAHLQIENFNRLGEFAIGFNRQITKLMNGKAVTNTLIAEKQDLHFALGDGYPNTGGKNKCNLHVDIPVSSGPGAGLTISGLHDNSQEYMMIYRDGKFTEEFLNLNSTFNWKEYDNIKWD